MMTNRQATIIAIIIVLCLVVMLAFSAWRDRTPVVCTRSEGITECHRR